MQSKAGIKGLSGVFSDGLFTWLCSRQLAFDAHYGEAREYSQYYYVVASKALKAASIVMLVSALLITESNFSSAIEHKRSIELLGQQAEEYKRIYKKRFEEYETVFEHARSMNAAVDMADRIYQNGKTSPLDFMIGLSEVLTQSGLGDTQLDKIEWKLQQYKDMGDAQQVSEEKPDVTSEDPVRHVGLVHGRINISDKNYRGSVAQVNKIITALRKSERIELVEALEMPVEVRSERAFTDETGVSAIKIRKESGGKFLLKVVMRGATHE
ncbi:MAG: hypothetical protein OQK32_03260 [Gammaproteobacteria bacterium]|nr:hypothetical protein [Gammaproteobacteria bacterium]